MKGNWETAPLVRAWLCKREGLCSDSYVKASMTEYACNPESREKTGKPPRSCWPASLATVVDWQLCESLCVKATRQRAIEDT